MLFRSDSQWQLFGDENELGLTTADMDMATSTSSALNSVTPVVFPAAHNDDDPYTRAQRVLQVYAEEQEAEDEC